MEEGEGTQRAVTMGKSWQGLAHAVFAIGLNVPTVTRRDCAGMRKARDRVCEGSRKPEPWIRALGGGGGRGHAPSGSVPPPRRGGRALALVLPAGTRDTAAGARAARRGCPLAAPGGNGSAPTALPGPGRAPVTPSPRHFLQGALPLGHFLLTQPHQSRSRLLPLLAQVSSCEDVLSRSHGLGAGWRQSPGALLPRLPQNKLWLEGC